MTRGGGGSAQARWWLSAAVLWACVARGGTDWGDCGNIAACTCKWSSGKKSASCPSAGLTALPALSPYIQVLDMHDNDLRALEREAFADAGLLNLQRINLRKARLRTLHAEAFRELRILVELDLADNELIELTPGTFRGNERLRLLVLSGNPLAALVRDQFPPLPHLRTLELAGCRLHSVHSLALRADRLPLLDSVDLRRNLLTSLRLRALASLPSLKTLAIAGNPWCCDCRLRDFHDWYLTSNLGTEDVTCTAPAEFAARSWRGVGGYNMTCAPEVKPSTRVLRAEPGTDISFGCFTRGDPQPHLFWTVDGRETDNETSNGEIIIEESTVKATELELDEGIISDGWWANVSISNVTSNAAGEWTCIASSSAGEVRATVSLVLPRVRTATARSPPEFAPSFGVLAGSLFALLALGFVSSCACWHARRRSVPPSRSFTDQEKKLLDVSIAATDRSSADLGSFELPDRPLSLDVDSPPPALIDPLHITIEGTGGGAFPPPPAEFALPAPYGNIFISVSVTGNGTPGSGAMRDGEYPDLLGGVGGATLPRRTRACCAVPAYDNMGPRVTAGGSSTWSLPGAAAAESATQTAPPPLPAVIVIPPPPPEFVSL